MDFSVQVSGRKSKYRTYTFFISITHKYLKELESSFFFFQKKKFKKKSKLFIDIFQPWIRPRKTIDE